MKEKLTWENGLVDLLNGLEIMNFDLIRMILNEHGCDIELLGFDVHKAIDEDEDTLDKYIYCRECKVTDSVGNFKTTNFYYGDFTLEIKSYILF